MRLPNRTGQVDWIDPHRGELGRVMYVDLDGIAEWRVLAHGVMNIVEPAPLFAPNAHGVDRIDGRGGAGQVTRQEALDGDGGGAARPVGLPAARIEEHRVGESSTWMNARKGIQSASPGVRPRGKSTRAAGEEGEEQQNQDLEAQRQRAARRLQTGRRFPGTVTAQRP